MTNKLTSDIIKHITERRKSKIATLHKNKFYLSENYDKRFSQYAPSDDKESIGGNLYKALKAITEKEKMEANSKNSPSNQSLNNQNLMSVRGINNDKYIDSESMISAKKYSLQMRSQKTLETENSLKQKTSKKSSKSPSKKKITSKEDQLKLDLEKAEEIKQQEQMQREQLQKEKIAQKVSQLKEQSQQKDQLSEDRAKTNINIMTTPADGQTEGSSFNNTSSTNFGGAQATNNTLNVFKKQFNFKSFGKMQTLKEDDDEDDYKSDRRITGLGPGRYNMAKNSIFSEQDE